MDQVAAVVAAMDEVAAGLGDEDWGEDELHGEEFGAQELPSFMTQEELELSMLGGDDAAYLAAVDADAAAAGGADGQPRVVAPRPGGVPSPAPTISSVHITNVGDECHPEELYAHFLPCGDIKRITIKVDPHTGTRVGQVYIDFADGDMADNAVLLDGSSFKGQDIQVKKKPRIASKGGSVMGKAPKGYGKGCGYGKDWYGSNYGGKKGGGWGKGYGKSFGKPY